MKGAVGVMFSAENVLRSREECPPASVWRSDLVDKDEGRCKPACGSEERTDQLLRLASVLGYLGRTVAKELSLEVYPCRRSGIEGPRLEDDEGMLEVLIRDKGVLREVEVSARQAGSRHETHQRGG